jgi:hypothetical protein
LSGYISRTVRCDGDTRADRREIEAVRKFERERGRVMAASRGPEELHAAGAGRAASARKQPARTVVEGPPRSGDDPVGRAADVKVAEARERELARAQVLLADGEAIVDRIEGLRQDGRRWARSIDLCEPRGIRRGEILPQGELTIDLRRVEVGLSTPE